MKTRFFFRNAAFCLGIAMFVSLTSSISVSALTNNDGGIPNDPVKAQMANWGQIPQGGSGRKCAEIYNNAQWGWVSSNTSTSQTVIALTNPVERLALKFNTVGAFCDSLVNSRGEIIDQGANNLLYTRTNILGSRSRIESINGTDPGNARVSSLGDKLTNEYLTARRTDQRYTNISSDGFEISGIGSKLKQGRNVIKIVVEWRAVNQFQAADPRFKCIANNSGTGNLDGAGCPITIGEFYIIINLPTQSAQSNCQVRLSRSEVAPGASFNAIFSLFNGGNIANNATWGVSGANAILLKKEAGQAGWPDEVAINGTNNDATFGPVVRPGLPRSETTVAFTAPTEKREYAMRYILSKKGTASLNPSVVCTATITVQESPPEEKENRPFLRVGGGDVVAGAEFSGYADFATQCRVRDESTNAKIDTNGYYGTSGPSPLGSSSAQYGVFATGKIGDNDPNNFVGNNGFTREDRKDLLFANAEFAQYGNFYAGERAPCFDLSVYTAEAQDAPTGVSLNNYVSDTRLGSGPAFPKVAIFENERELGLNNFSVEGNKVAIVAGDLTITGNVRYDDKNGAGYPTMQSIPNLTVLVIGNIYIEKGVEQLDGTYIAVPNSEGAGGLIDTCSSVSRGSWPAPGSDFRVASCNTKLTVNGSLVAQNALLKRTVGTVGSQEGTVPGSNSCRAGLECAAEFINFSPEAYFNNLRAGGNSSSIGDVPISSVELPPIY